MGESSPGMSCHTSFNVSDPDLSEERCGTERMRPLEFRTQECFEGTRAFLQIHDDIYLRCLHTSMYFQALLIRNYFSQFKTKNTS